MRTSERPKLEVADRFSLKPSKLGWLPISIVPVLAIVLLLVEPMSESNASSAGQDRRGRSQTGADRGLAVEETNPTTTAQGGAEGLKEAQELFEKMEADLDKITKREDMNRKDAMIAMNDLKKQLEERRRATRLIRTNASRTVADEGASIGALVRRSPSRSNRATLGKPKKWSNNWPAKCVMASSAKKKKSN